MEIITQSGMAMNEIRGMANTKHENEDKSGVKSTATPIQNETSASSGQNIYQENPESGSLSGVQDVVMEARTDRVETTFRSEMNGDKNIETEKVQSNQEMERIPQEEKNSLERNLESPKNMATLTDQLYTENAKKAYESQKNTPSWNYNILFH